MSERHERPLTPRLDFLFTIVQQAREQENAWLPGIRAEIAARVAYEVAHGKKFEIHHDHDSPWDQSGDLREVAGGFSAQDHETLGDFLSEPSGEKRPSYERGCGW